MSKKIYIDVGSNIGATVKHWKECLDPNGEFEIHAFECNPDFWAMLAIPGVILHKEAAMDQDGVIPFFIDHSFHSEGSSFDGTKTSGVIAKEPVNVPCIDFSKWLQDNFTKDDYIVLKINAEGAEYPILKKMMVDGTIYWVNKLFVWWHYIPVHFAHLTDAQAKTHLTTFNAIRYLNILGPNEEAVLLLFGKEGPPK
jgi:FkbM family methyltransferase